MYIGRLNVLIKLPTSSSWNELKSEGGENHAMYVGLFLRETYDAKMIGFPEVEHARLTIQAFADDIEEIKNNKRRVTVSFMLVTYH